VKRARRRTWTLEKLDRQTMWLLYWEDETSRWEVEPGSVMVIEDGHAIFQLENSEKP
jgi:hypothetical protein